MGTVMTDLHKLCRDQLCSRSGKPLRLSEFPRNRKMKDGRAIYCLECSLRRTHEYRRKLRDRKAVLKALKIDRKPMIAVPRETPRERVLNAIAKGHCTFEAIEMFTGLHEDMIADLLAVLAFDDKEVRLIRSTREFHLAA